MSRTGRPRQFSEEAVLDVAMDVFWTGGFDAPIERVIERTGVGRQSLYGAFGDKQGLFLRALGRYTQDINKATALERPGPVLPVIKQLLDSSVDRACATPGRGCMLGNTAADLVPGHPEVTDAVRAAYGQLRGALETALGRARDEGEVRDDQPVAAQAAAVLAFMQGIALLSRAERDPGVLRPAAAILLAGLRA
jgi:TetR/AcrR family transcriptional repressor of nem operon